VLTREPPTPPPCPLLGHVQKLVEVHAAVGELAEGPLLLLLHFRLRDGGLGVSRSPRPNPQIQGGPRTPGPKARGEILPREPHKERTRSGLRGLDRDMRARRAFSKAKGPDTH
jgi:hypothetical protein